MALVNAAIAWSVPRRAAAGGLVLAILHSLSTYLYFVPNMFKLWRQRDCAGPRPSSRAGWLQLNPIRHAAGLLAFFTALKALSMAG